MTPAPGQSPSSQAGTAAREIVSSLAAASTPLQSEPSGVASGASAQPTSSGAIAAAPSKRWSWPRIWEYSLAFVLGACALLVGQTAWKQARPPQPLADAIGSVDLNRADISTLKQLPGIGPHLAARIIEHREHHGPFHSVDDLQNVLGIGPVTLERLRPMVFVSQPQPVERSLMTDRPESGSPTPKASTDKKRPARPADLNRATRDELMSIPGIGPVMADRILEDRRANGPYRSVNDLTRVRGIKEKTVEKLAPYVTVSPAKAEP
jgi:competence ComEA-like helix-hairpin-helix protein